MPPKKKLCRSKDQRSIIEVFRGSSDESENSSNDQTKPAPLEDTPKQPPTNKFIPKWFKLYSWLKYNQEKDFMFCNICTEHGKRNGMVEHCQNRNFKKTTLDRHAVLPDHQAAIQAPILKEDFQACQAKSSSKEDKAVTVLMKVVKWLCDEDVPLSKYKSMMNLHQDLCVPDIAILQTGINYDSQYTANDLLDSLSAYADNELSQKMCASPFVTILADESTDISNTKRLVIYTQIIDDGMVPSTHYVCNVECTDATGKGIAQAILSEMESRGISKDQIMSFGSDGASVMTGKHNGINSAVYIQFLTLCTMIFETVNEKKPLLHFQLLYTQIIPLLSITGSSFEMFSDVLQRHARLFSQTSTVWILTRLHKCAG